MAKTESWHVARTLRALELLSERPFSETDLAHELKVHPRTARRLLARLVTEGYVAQARLGTGYTATLKVVTLAGRVIERTDLVRTAFPYVVALRNRTGEASHLSVPGEEKVIHLIQETGESVVMVKPRLGEQVPYHCTAVGKALLAYLPEHCERLLGHRLQQFTKYTIVDPAALRSELRKTRERGYAFDDREYSLELRCVAAPVFAASGELVAAIGVSAPASRLPTRQSSNTGKVVLETSNELSEALGFRPRGLIGSLGVLMRSQIRNGVGVQK